MDSRTTVSITDARKKIFDITEDVQKPGVYFTLTEKGRPKAVMMSAEEFDSIIETMEVMADIPELDKEIKELESDIKTGKYKSYITLEELLAKDGYVLTNKPGNKNGISFANKTKRAKRTRKTAKR